MPLSHAEATERVRRFYNRTAQQYDGSIAFFERLLFADGRQWVCSRAHGQVLEIAAGTGRNLRYYPADVRLSAIELSPGHANHRTQASRRAAPHRGLPFRQRAIPGVFGPTIRHGRRNTVVVHESPDRRAVAEAHRVLRPRGRLLLLDHVRSPARAVRICQRLLDPIAAHFEGDLMREPLDYLASLGFGVEECERSKWGIVERVAARKTT